MPKNEITLVLSLKVKYALNGTRVEELVCNLEQIARHAAGEGQMSVGTEAEVETWEASVVEA